VAAAEIPAACFAEVARRYDVSRGVVELASARRGELGPAAAAAFLPVRIMPETTDCGGLREMISFAAQHLMDLGTDGCAAPVTASAAPSG
jgi:hypothetical protein